MDKLKRLGQVYDLSIEVKVGTSVTDVTDVTDIGLDKLLTEWPHALETAERNEKQDNFYDNKDKLILSLRKGLLANSGR